MSTIFGGLLRDEEEGLKSWKARPSMHRATVPMAKVFIDDLLVSF
jgi:hypothetical protein